MANVSVTDYTQTTATIEITNLSTASFAKFFTLRLNGDYIDGKEALVRNGESFTYTYEGLNPGTYYTFSVAIQQMLSGEYEYETSVEGWFETESSGGGGGEEPDEPYFEAYAENNTDIYVVARNLAGIDYDSISYDISSSSHNDSATVSGGSHTFEGVPNGIYSVEAWYNYNNRPHRIYTADGGSSIPVEITGSGGGGGGEEDTWAIESEDLGTLTSQYMNYHSYAAYTLYRRVVMFSQSGSVTFRSAAGTVVEASDTKGWITNHVNTYNSDDGTPPASATILASGDDEGGNRQFSMTITVSAYTQYDFWFRLYSGESTGYSYIIIDPPSGGGGSWTYTSGYSDLSNISSDTTQTVSLSSYTGAMFRASFTSAGNARFLVSSGESAFVYVTDANYGWRSDSGVPLDQNSNDATGGTDISFSVTPGHGYYYIWVQGSTASTSGSAVITIIPPSSASIWTEVNVGDVNMTNTNRSFSLSMSPYRVYRYNIRFSTTGTTRIYCTGGSITSDPKAYFGDTNSGIDQSTGIPISSYYAWDDVVSGNSRDYNFDSGDLNVIANRTYYLWVKGIDESHTPNIVIYINAIDTGGHVWIHNGTTWVQATPYIYDGSSWVKVTPYIYNGSSWVAAN